SYHTELLFFFFQAEDGIRDFHVTGVQTCALPIYEIVLEPDAYFRGPILTVTGARPSILTVQTSPGTSGPTPAGVPVKTRSPGMKIGRASCRERVEVEVVDVSLQEKVEKEEGEERW